MEKISLVITALNPNEFKINRMLQSAKGFDKIYLHIDPATKTFPKIDAGRLQIEPCPDFIDSLGSLGIGEAYNFIINQIESDWICTFCDDDFFDEKELSRLLEAIRRGDFADADVVHFKSHVAGNVPYHAWGAAVATKEMLEQSNVIPASSFFRKSTWEKAKGFSGTLYHDWIFWLRCMDSGARFKYFDANVYWYMMRGNSTSVKQQEGMTFEEARVKVLEYARS